MRGHEVPSAGCGDKPISRGGCSVGVPPPVEDKVRLLASIFAAAFLVAVAAAAVPDGEGLDTVEACAD